MAQGGREQTLLLPDHVDPLRIRPVRLALTLGLRPKGEQRDHLPHAFALLRGLTIDALISKYWSLMSSSALTPPTPIILPLEVASVYASIKRNLLSPMPSVTNFDARSKPIRSYSPRVIVLARKMMLSLNSNKIGWTLAYAPTIASNSSSDIQHPLCIKHPYSDKQLIL